MGMNSAWPRGQAARLPGGSPRGACRPLGLAPSLPAPCRAPRALPARDSRQRATLVLPAAARPNQHHQAPAGTFFHIDNTPWSLTLTRSPSTGKEGLGWLEGTDLETIKETWGSATQHKGSPQSLPTRSPTRPPPAGLCCRS